MKIQRKFYRTALAISLFLCGVIVFVGGHVFAEEWNESQMEVWKLIEADWELRKQGDVEKLLASRHAEAVIWWNDKPMPIDKKMAQYNFKGWLDYDKPVNCELKPLAIQLFGNVAIVSYTYKFNGKKMSGTGRKMETWIKQDNNWFQISDFSDLCDKLPPCE